ncbi:rRNA-processing protein utp23 [Cladorrhinum samala]|uniref:U three protein 23 n=1 Tax=Cladorrhinum samala TaxID=585594 RepID=A0AAV9HM72_9PEZI|nr:rRNA-processing protein utp23 [Cladorrhinum samala]
MGKRVKQYKKLMRSFQMLGFREPYQLLMTSDILMDTLKLDLLTLFEKTLSTKNLKPMITQCCIRALYAKNMGPNRDPNAAAAIERAKTFERRRCGHLMDEDPKPERECMLSVVDPKRRGENKFRYIVATQDDHLREMLRSVVPTPLMYVKRSVLILEPMAESSQKARDREERAKFMSGIVRGSKRKREDDDDEGGGGGGDKSEDEADSGDERAKKKEEEEKPKKKKKNYGPKGPNPLAVKKKKRRDADAKDQKKAKKAPAGAAQTAAATASATGETSAENKAKRKRRKKTTTSATGEGSKETATATSADAGTAVAASED